ncbi:MAG: cytochrome b/b6 domain-containing protein, partial [Thiohalomonadales bacterium]
MKQAERRVLPIVIWDLPTRLFHWLFVAGFTIAWITHDDNRFLYLHVFSGYLFLGLLLFRLVWGVIGTHFARFVSFAHDWKSVSVYLISLLNGSSMRYIGHNPAGGWAIFLMLLLALVVSITGVLTLGGEEGHGPLAGYIHYGVGIIARDIHEVSAWALLAVVVAHLGGVIVESVLHRENLIWAMISGRKETVAGVRSVRGHHLVGLLIVIIVSSSAVIYFRGYLVETADHLYQPY